MAAADSRLGQLIAASRPSRPWLHLTVPPWWARVLIAAGARPAPDPDTGKGQELTAEAAPNADPTRADQKDAKLTPRRADLADANLYGANLRGADLRGADLATSIFLIQSQLDTARGDRGTRLPPPLTRPAHWPGR